MKHGWTTQKLDDLFEFKYGKGLIAEHREVDGSVKVYGSNGTIRFKLRKKGITSSWTTIREELSTHERISTTIKREDGKTIHIRKSSRSEPIHIRFIMP
ncbi:MAG: hypothetical protein Q7J31_05055 [Syntrophales bacterium]|nr:hypothetical protein [Syntrophales bacterium]